MGGILQKLAPFLASGWTISVVLSALALWAAISGSSLRRAASSVRRALRKATRRVEQATSAAEFARQYEAIADEFSNDPVLGHRWREFDDSLLIPGANARRRLIHSTARPDSWFDIGLLSFGRNGVDLRYHAALPNLLVGMGLFFTFLGLAVALSVAGNVVSGSAQVRNDALKGLLDAASFKFLTSLVGLLLSILYALFRKSELNRTEKALDTFNAALEARAPLVTQADLLRDANELLEKQNTSIEGLANDLSIKLEGVFDASFNTSLERHLGPLAQALDRLSERLSSQNEQGMQRMLDSFLTSLQGGASDRMHDVASSLAGLGRNLEGMQTGLGDAAVRIAQSADAMATRMGEGAEAALARVTEQMGSLSESLRAIADQTRAASADAGQELVRRIEEAAQGFEESARSVGLTLAGAGTGLSTALEKAADDAGGALGRGAEALGGAAVTLAGRMIEFERAAAEATVPLSSAAADLKAASASAREAAQPMSQSAQEIGRASDQVAGAIQKLRDAHEASSSLAQRIAQTSERFAGVDATIGTTIRQLQEGLTGFARQSLTLNDRADAAMAKAVAQLEQSIRSLEGVFEDTLDEIKDRNVILQKAVGHGSR